MEYVENTDWKEYYEETDPDKRREIYDRIVNEKEDDGANELRLKLYELRFIDPKKPDKTVDKGVWQMVILPINLRPQYRHSGRSAREIRQSLAAMGIDQIKEDDEVTRSAVYWEIRNTARRYLQSCQGPKYARKYFGIMQSTDEEKIQKTAEDIYAMVELAPEVFGMQEEMQVFADAIRDEFVESSDATRKIYASVVTEKREKSGGFMAWFKGY